GRPARIRTSQSALLPQEGQKVTGSAAGYDDTRASNRDLHRVLFSSQALEVREEDVKVAIDRRRLRCDHGRSADLNPLVSEAAEKLRLAVRSNGAEVDLGGGDVTLTRTLFNDAHTRTS